MLSSAAVKWIKEKASKASIEDDRQKLRWLDPYLGEVGDLNQITRERVDFIMRERGIVPDAAAAQNATANRYVALIGGILNAAEKEWEWGNKAPVLKRYKEPESNGRCLAPEEWRRLASELPSHLALAALFSLSTGLREAKVFGLRWDQISLTDRTLTFGGTAKMGWLMGLEPTTTGITILLALW